MFCKGDVCTRYVLALCISNIFIYVTLMFCHFSSGYTKGGAVRKTESPGLTKGGAVKKNDSQDSVTIKKTTQQSG